MIRIARELSLPIDAVTQTLAQIGRKGAGKTYLAQLVAEQMLDAEAQVVVLDPVGNWWALRVGADGRSKGKDLFVLGGEHGDVPLTPESGAKVARFVVEKRVSAVLDVSGFREGERKRFAADFAEEFFHRKKTSRSPVHLVIEEAQKFIPQRCGPDETRMLGAFENIVRLGRNYGIGASLVTQRPQSVNKEVLSQVECLFVLQVNGTHERKALEEWVQEAGADRKLVGELPGLGQGEGYVWSPSWLRIFHRVRFGKKVTFDASATPEVGKATKAATLAAVDVDALRADLAEVVKAAEADDPKALKRRVAELERQAQKGKSIESLAMTLPPKPVEVPVLPIETLHRFEQKADHLLGAVQEIRQIAAGLFDEVRVTLDTARALATRKMSTGLSTPSTRTPTASAHPVRKSVPRAVQGTDIDLSRPQQRLLDALLWLHDVVRIPSPTRRQVALVAEVSSKSSGFEKNVSTLKTAGLIDYPGDGRLALNDAGRAIAEPTDQALTPEQLQESLYRRVSGPQAVLLKVLVKAYPLSMSRDALADEAEVSALSSGFEKNLSTLRSLGLIDYPADCEVAALPLLFLEGE